MVTKMNKIITAEAVWTMVILEQRDTHSTRG